MGDTLEGWPNIQRLPAARVAGTIVFQQRLSCTDLQDAGARGSHQQEDGSLGTNELLHCKQDNCGRVKRGVIGVRLTSFMGNFEIEAAMCIVKDLI